MDGPLVRLREFRQGARSRSFTLKFAPHRWTKLAHDSANMTPSARADPLWRRWIIWLSFRLGGVSGAAPLDDESMCKDLMHLGNGGGVVQGVSPAIAFVPKKNCVCHY